ncbi:hypothetical protein [Symbioplanes lichenis]|uniref:hypothetical protein n=1 Tax=Symbioplanes lichenis TaxID=1629072 RepID=UPI00273A46F7|nr:hypothetical protein [Actinoplanes lichenis]
MVNAWLARAGRDGEKEPAAPAEGLIIAGWPERGDLTDKPFALRFGNVVSSRVRG